MDAKVKVGAPMVLVLSELTGVEMCYGEYGYWVLGGGAIIGLLSFHLFLFICAISQQNPCRLDRSRPDRKYEFVLKMEIKSLHPHE